MRDQSSQFVPDSSFNVVREMKICFHTIILRGVNFIVVLMFSMALESGRHYANNSPRWAHNPGRECPLHIPNYLYAWTMCIEAQILSLYLVMWIDYECLKIRGHIAFFEKEYYIMGVIYS